MCVSVRHFAIAAGLFTRLDHLKSALLGQVIKLERGTDSQFPNCTVSIGRAAERDTNKRNISERNSSERDTNERDSNVYESDNKRKTFFSIKVSSHKWPKPFKMLNVLYLRRASFSLQASRSSHLP